MASQVWGKGAKMDAAAACLVEGLTISKATKVIWLSDLPIIRGVLFFTEQLAWLEPPAQR